MKRFNVTKYINLLQKYQFTELEAKTHVKEIESIVDNKLNELELKLLTSSDYDTVQNSFKTNILHFKARSEQLEKLGNDKLVSNYAKLSEDVDKLEKTVQEDCKLTQSGANLDINLEKKNMIEIGKGFELKSKESHEYQGVKVSMLESELRDTGNQARSLIFGLVGTFVSGFLTYIFIFRPSSKSQSQSYKLTE